MITVDGNGSAEVPNDESTVPTTLEVSPEPTKEVSDISPEEVTSNDQATSADQPEPEFAAESLVNETVTSMEVDEPLTTIETGEAPVDASVAPEPVEELPQEAPVVEEETSTIPEAEAETVSFDVDGLRVEAEKFEDDNQSYGSIGGMLALGRQQVVLDLVAEHDGVFPGGNELRHAFNRRYKKKNPKAGIADRRLIRGVVQSLQYKGKLNQYTFSFKAPRGGGGSTIVTKKVLVNPRHTMDSPLVIDTIRKMKAADGGLWFPPNTDLPSDIQEKIRNPITTWVQSVPSAIEDIKFDRMFPTSIETLKKQREARAAERALRNAQKAEEKRVRSELRALKRSADGSHPAKWDTIKFTDEQRAEARQRKAELELKMRQLRTKFIVPGGDEVEEERPALQTVWWNDFVHRDEKSFLADVKDVKQWEILNGQDNEFLKPLNNEDLAMINHFGPMVNVGSDFQQVSVSNLDHTIKTTGAGLAITSRTAYRPRNRPLIIYDDNGDPIVKKRRKREAKNPPAVSRRVQAMNDIHQTKTLDGTTSKADDEQEGMIIVEIWELGSAD